MSETTPSPNATPRELISAIPRWKKIAFSLASAVLLGGIGMQVASSMGAQEPDAGALASTHRSSASSGVDNALVQKMLPDGSKVPAGSESPASSDGTGEADPFLEEWSPALVKGGLGFVIGFSIGFALRTFLKFTLFIAGIVFAAILVLSWGEYIVPNWDKANTDFDKLTAALPAQFQGVKTFLQGSLPSAGLTIFGLVSGFKKK